MYLTLIKRQYIYFSFQHQIIAVKKNKERKRRSLNYCQNYVLVIVKAKLKSNVIRFKFYNISMVGFRFWFMFCVARLGKSRLHIMILKSIAIDAPKNDTCMWSRLLDSEVDKPRACTIVVVAVGGSSGWWSRSHCHSSRK